MSECNDIHDNAALLLFGKNKSELNDEERLTWAEYCWDLDHPEWRKVEGDNGANLQINQTGTAVKSSDGLRFIHIIVPTQSSRLKYDAVFVKNETIGNWRTQLVHRLVAKAFVPNPDPENKIQVNHINGRKRCNWYKNLEWVTPKENSQLAFATGLTPKGEDHWRSKYTNDQIRSVCQLLRDHPEITIEKVSEETGVGEAAVRNILYGFQWKQISKDYMPFPERDNHGCLSGDLCPAMKYKDEQVEQVCQLLDEVYSGKQYLTHQQIADIAGVPKGLVDQVSLGKSRIGVSSKYNFYKCKYGEEVLNESARI